MIAELCRLCGSKSGDGGMLNIFSENGAAQKLCVKIEEVVRIHITEEDALPNMICPLCIKNLENAHYFVNYCHQTQAFLQELCQKSNSSEDSKDIDGFYDSADHVANQQLGKTNQFAESITGKEECSRAVSSDFPPSKGNDEYLNFLDKLTSNGEIESSSNDMRKTSNEPSDVSSKSCSLFTDRSAANLNFAKMKDDSVSKGSVFINTTPTGIRKISTSFREEDTTFITRSYLKRKCSSEHTTIINESEETFENLVRNTFHKDSDFEETDEGDEIELNDEYGDGDFESFSNKAGKRPKTIKSLKNYSSRKSLRTKKKGIDILNSKKSSDEAPSNMKECTNGTRKEIKEKKQLSCDTCKMKFTQELTYQEHLNVHTGNRPFFCKLCEASFRKRQELNQHLRTVHSEKQFKCPLCDHIAKHKGKLTEHMKSVHEKPFACDLCNYRTGEKGKIGQHIANKHTGDLSYVCEICGNGFKTKTSLQTHRQNIHFPEPKVCQTCGTICPSLAKYSAHIFRCGKEKKRFPCDKCGNTYVNKEILKDHMNKHLNIRPYKCEVCGKEFFQRNRLDTHKYVHRGAAYSCEICHHVFNRKDNMKNHMKKHFYKSMRYDNMIVTAV